MSVNTFEPPMRMYYLGRGNLKVFLCVGDSLADCLSAICVYISCRTLTE